MPNATRSRNSRDRYAGSPLAELNDARARTAALRPLRMGDQAVAQLLLNPKKVARITTMAELAAESAKVDELAGQYESFLLIVDEFNPGSFNKKALYDYAAEPQSSGDFLCDVHEGQLLLAADTLVYWD